MTSIQHSNSQQHSEPERPVVYEPPDLRGRKHVEKVASEYRVREDECLADKLQHEEFELHFGKNKDERQRGQIDIKKAKQIYLREVEDSGLLSTTELKTLCKDDSFIAHEISRRIQEEKEMEVQRKAATEMQDEEFARYLEAKEKEKLELERKRRLERRIAQDRAAAEKFARQLEIDSGLNQGVAGLQVSASSSSKNRNSQKGGSWDIDFEVGASAGSKTKEELRILKDSEVIRTQQLQETEQEKKRLEEERDRKMALKLQREEAEQYKREKEERERIRRDRRESQKRQEHDTDIQIENTNGQIRQKSLQPVDATGKPENANGQIRQKRLQSVDATGKPVSSAQQSESGIENSAAIRKGSHKRKENGEPVYLQAVDATGRPVKQPSHETRDLNLVEEQRSLQQQMRQVDQIGKGARSRDSRTSSTKRADHQYDTPENHQEHHHTNVAATIDPTYSTIDSLPRQNGRHQGLDEQGNIRPAPVIQNVKRQQPEDKKKKKWFSKKEKSK